MPNVTKFHNIPVYDLLKKHYKGMHQALQRLRREGRQLTADEKLVIFAVMDKVATELEA